MNVAVVTDSTGYLPAELLPSSLTVLPLHVVIGGRSALEGVDVTADEVAAALRRKDDVTTSQVTPAAFAAAYQSLAAGGASEIVSIHMSAKLSGTYQAAVSAAAQAPVPVHCVDSETVALALGLAARGAALLAESGASAAEVVEDARRRSAGSQTWLVVDSLEQLRRGGRIGTASALLGSVLMIKPILQISEGQVATLEKQRTLTRAIARMAELVVAAAQGQPCQIAVQHASAAARSAELAEHLRRVLPAAQVVQAEVGAVIAAHVGLATISVAVCPL
ncbi:MAG: DegV family protein [Candidatus Nanopelagicales bacterium]